MNISPFCQNAPKSRGTMFDGVARGMLPAPSMRTCCAGGGGGGNKPRCRGGPPGAKDMFNRTLQQSVRFSLLDKKPCICNN